MRSIDHFSYELGAADCFCEMVRAGVKQIALAHPCDTREARDEYLPYFEDLCQKYGVKLYVEDVPLLTDLFPLSMNQGKYNAIFYQEDSALDAYLALKAEKQAALGAGATANCCPTPMRASSGCWNRTRRRNNHRRNKPCP